MLGLEKSHNIYCNYVEVITFLTFKGLVLNTSDLVTWHGRCWLPGQSVIKDDQAFATGAPTLLNSDVLTNS